MPSVVVIVPMPASHGPNVTQNRATTSLLASLPEQRAVGVESGLAAEVGVQHGRVFTDVAGANEIDEGGHGLSLVDGVQDDALESAGQPDSVQRRGDGYAVDVTGPA